MAATQQRRLPTPERDAESQVAPLQREPADLRHGNDNLEQALAIEELSQAKRRTWEIFARWLMLGGAGFALLLIAVLGFVYSGYP